jgi:predicted aspartyl protease
MIEIETDPAAPDSRRTSYSIAALIDTGANLNAIDDAWAQQMRLPIVDQVSVSGISGTITLSVYFARIVIAGLAIDQLGRFTGVHLQAGGQSHLALLGRELLKDCRLVYDGPTGSVLLSR